jgi:hypothetical protein
MAFISRNATPPSVSNSKPSVNARRTTESKSKSRNNQIKYQSSKEIQAHEYRSNPLSIDSPFSSYQKQQLLNVKAQSGHV